MEPAVELLFHARLGDGPALTADPEAIDASGLPMIVVEKSSGAILAASNGAIEFYGQSRQELVRLTIFDLSSRSKSPGGRRDVFSTPIPDGLTHSRFPRHITRSGSAYDIDALGLDVSYRGKPARLVLIASSEPVAQGLAGRNRFAHRFELLAEQMREGLWITSGETGDLRYLNPAFERIMGTPREEFLQDSRKLYECVLAEDRAHARQFWADTVRGESAVTEFRITHPDGTVRWVRTYSFPFDDGSGEALFCGVFEDITERKRSEAGLIENERLLHSLFEDSVIGQAVVSPEGKWLRVNPALCRITGYEAAELLGTDLQSITHPGDLPDDVAWIKGVLAGSDALYDKEKRYIRKDGTPVWVHVTGKVTRDAAGRPRRVIAQIVDISARKTAEAASRDSEAHYRRMVETAEEGILIVDADQRIDFMNQKMAAMLGYEADEVLGRPLHVLADEGGRAEYEPRLRRRRQGVREQYEFRFRRKDGRGLWGWVSASPIMDEAGRYAGALAMVTDITERKRAEEALKASETKYRVLIDNSVDSILLADPDGNLIDINRQGEHLLGYSKKELYGLTVARIHPQEELPRVQAAFSQAVDGGYAEYLDGLVLTKDGRKVPVDIRASAIEIGGRKFMQGTFQDITERKERERRRAEEEIAHRNALVREVHHRIKNNLQGITGLLRRFAAGHPEIAPILSEAAGQVQSVAVIHGLQGRAPAGHVAVCDLVRSIAANVETLVQARIDMNIAPHCDPCFILAEAEAVPTALVLNELLFNAVKHGRPDTPVRVEVGIDEAGGRTEIRMINTGRLPPGFGLAGQAGEGSGLQLIASLLPRQGALLEWNEEGGEVAAALTLGAPVVLLARFGSPGEPSAPAAAR